MKGLALLVLFALNVSIAEAQDTRVISDSVIRLHAKIELAERSSNYDLLDSANRALLDYLMTHLNGRADMLSAHLKSAYSFRSRTSTDGKLRILAWDDMGGGTMRHHYAVGLFSTIGSGAKTVLLSDTSEGARIGFPTIDTIYTMEAKDGKVYYLPLFIGKYSTKDVSQILECWTIERGRLKRDINLFHGTKRRFNTIDVYYDYFTNMNNERMIHLEEDSLFVPLVEGDTVTKQWLVYKFDGQQYKYTGKTK